MSYYYTNSDWYSPNLPVTDYPISKPIVKPSDKRKYVVLTTDFQEITVYASMFEKQGESVLFYNEDYRVIAMFNHWISVQEVD